MKSGAVVVTYQTSLQQLELCLESLRVNGVKNIAIVDNNESNVGFAAGSNKGAKKINNEFILFINPDAALAEGALELAEDYLGGNKEVGIVGFKMCSPGQSSVERSYGAVVSPASLVWRKFVPHNTEAKKVIEVGWVSGGAMLVRRGLFEELGGFDEEFFLYWEDVDLCLRAKKVGKRVVYLPGSVVFHKKGASLADRDKKTKTYDESADKYFRKHYPDWICKLQRNARRLYRLVYSQVD